MESIKFNRYTSLNGNWNFRFDTGVREDCDFDIDRYCCNITIPGYWDDFRHELLKITSNISEYLVPVPNWEKDSEVEYDNFTYLCGTGSYMTQFKIPPLKKSNRVIFVVSEVLYSFKLYINRRFVQSFSGHRSIFRIDITDYIVPDTDNQIVISVNNIEIDKTACPYPDGFCGGVLGDVGYYIMDGNDFDDCFCYLSMNNDLIFRVSLSNPPEEKTMVLYSISDGDDVILEGKQEIMDQSCSWTINCPDLTIWHLGASKLYDVTYRLIANDVESCVIMKTGFRKLSTNGRKIMFNDKPVYIRANCHSNHYPNHCSLPYDAEYHKQHLDTLRKLGFNTTKYLYSFPPQVCLDYADQIGMPVMISVDIRPQAVLEDTEYEKALNQTKAYIDSIKHHPCVSVIRLSGESYCYDWYIERLKGIYDQIKKCSPQILVLPSHAPLGADYGININDKDTFHEPYLRNIRLFRKLLKCTDVVGHFPNGIISYQCPGSSGWKEVDNQASVYNHPMLSHELGMKGSTIDIRRKGDYTSRLPQKYVYDLEKGLEENNILDKADRYYQMSCLVQQEVRKYCIEETRLCRTLAGYEYLGAFDHFAVMSYPCGFADEFMQLKYGDTYEKNRIFQQDTVILLDFPDRKVRTVLSDHDFQGVWTVSHFGKSAIENGTLKVMLIEDGQIISDTLLDVGYIPNGEVCPLTLCEIKWPKVTEPTKITVKAILSWEDESTMNQWDFYVFPKVCRSSVSAMFLHNTKDSLSRLIDCNDYTGSDLAFSSHIDHECLQHLQKGDRLIIFGSGNFYSFGFGHPLATGHSSSKKANVGTCVNSHYLTNNISNDGYGGWQFYPIMTERTKAVVFNNEVPFDPIIEVISADKEVRKQGVLFEYNVGKGRLLVYTGEMIPNNPASTWFVHKLIEYVNSNHFQPVHSITEEQLQSLLQENKQTIQAKRTVYHIKEGREYSTAAEMVRSKQSIKVFPISSGLSKGLDNATQDYMAGSASQGAMDIINGSGVSGNHCTVDMGVWNNKLYIYFELQKEDLDTSDDLVYPDRGSGHERMSVSFKTDQRRYNYSISRNKEGAFVTGYYDPRYRIKVGVETKENRLVYDIVCPLETKIDNLQVDLDYSHRIKNSTQFAVEVFKCDLHVNE